MFVSLAGLCVPAFADARHVAVKQQRNPSDPPLHTLGAGASSTIKAAATRTDSVVITVGEPDTEDGDGYTAT